jgi:rhodanese-related sulfurtransferase
MGLLDFLGASTSFDRSTEAKDLVAKGALLLDVRTHEEFASGHIPGAKNIPVQELGRRLGELAVTKTPVVVYCRSGGRSASAASVLRQAGHTVCDLGAMSNWRS